MIAGRALVAGGIALIVTGVLQAQGPTFSSRARTVRVDVSVRQGGQPVTGLGAADFDVLDSGVRQVIDYVGQEDTPVNVVLALDTAKRTGPVVYTVTMQGRRDAFVDDLTRLTGGRTIDVSSLDKVGDAVAEILNEARQRYLVSYTPTGVATYLGDSAEVTFEQLKEAVDVLLDDPMERKTMTRCARNTFDGRGPDRIVNGMEVMLHSPARSRVASAVPLKIAA